MSDGRESFLTYCVGKAGGDAARAWRLFSEHAALGRAKGSNVSRRWSVEDAEAKALAWRKNAEKRRNGVRSVGRPRASLREALTSEQRQAHVAATERAHREGRIGATAVQLSAAMLDLAAGHLGACTASIPTLGSTVGRGRSTVAKARDQLARAGLWKCQRPGIYNPVLSGEFFEGQPADFQRETAPTVQHPPGSKVSVGGAALRAPISWHHRTEDRRGSVPEWGAVIESLRSQGEGIAPALAAMRVQTVGPPPISLRLPNPFPMRNLHLCRAPARGSLDHPVKV